MQVLFPSHSPWRNINDNGDEGSFLNLTGFSREAFEELHDYLYIGHQNHVGPGHSRLLNARYILGIILFHLGCF